MSPALPRTRYEQIPSSTRLPRAVVDIDDRTRSNHSEKQEIDLTQAIDLEIDLEIDLREPRSTSSPSSRPVPPDARFIDDRQGLVGAGPIAKAVKRVTDVIGATALLIALGPLMALIALLVRLTSRGPVFFRQERVGEGGRPFEMLKFRTMRVDAEHHREALEDMNEADGPVFKIRHDPRVTRIGRPLRRWSLDELPQLFNVLRGEMSLVGPRPPIPSEVETYNVWELQRLLARPGLTCIWQVSGRSEVDFKTWVEMDVEYIWNWTPTLDMVLLAKTVPAVLKRDGAY